MRELAEETGLTADDVTIVAEFPEWLAYELPWSTGARKWAGVRFSAGSCCV
ncbi:MAG: NUDIX domain-containing protein [Ardenticatenia bacterium]|nr:NUDIX domain-containing protein [Ardenticatenia bacterium]